MGRQRRKKEGKQRKGVAACVGTIPQEKSEQCDAGSVEHHQSVL